MSLRWAAAAGWLLCGLPAATAQAPLPPVRPADHPAPEEAAPAVAFQLKVEQLAELMGTLTYLRDLCGYGDGHLWRDKMNDLLAAEPSNVEHRERLAGAYNRGFRDYAVTYRVCTDAAQEIIDRSLDAGTALSQELSRRFAE